MKIVQIIPSFNVGGGELLAVRLCAEIKRQQPSYKVFLVSLYDPIPSIVYDEALASGAEILTLGKKKGFDPSILLRMANVLRNIKPDVIHTHLAGLRYTLLAGLMCRNAVKIHTVHNIADYEASSAVKQVHKIAFKIFGWMPVALSETVKQSIFNVYKVDAHVVNNGIGINLQILNAPKDTLRKELNLPCEHQLIITIGRLWKQKNQALLIEAYQQLCRKNNNCSLLIVGEDPSGGNFRKILENKVSNFPENIRDNIYFLGARKDIPKLLRTADVFVLSSDWEGVPLTLLEAMGYGIPTVCTAVGGVPDIIEHGITGLLVPKGDTNALAGAISEILDNQSFASQVSDNAQQQFKQRYSIEITTHGYLELYERNLKHV